jgi:hypothetical protein
MLLLTLLVVVLAQGLSSVIWVAQLRASQLQACGPAPAAWPTR